MKLPPLRSRADVTTNYGFFAYVIFRKRRATQPKKLQNSVSQVKRNPHGKIQLFLSTFKNSRKTRGTLFELRIRQITSTQSSSLVSGLFACSITFPARNKHQFTATTISTEKHYFYEHMLLFTLPRGGYNNSC